MSDTEQLLKKLRFNTGFKAQIINAPLCFTALCDAVHAATIHNPSPSESSVSFCLAFVHNQAELQQIVPALLQNLQGDALLWFAYPKKTSPLYQGDLHRDTGWQLLGQTGFEVVTQVALDQDWSALRFRHVRFIKQLKRDPKRRLTLG